MAYLVPANGPAHSVHVTCGAEQIHAVGHQKCDRHRARSVDASHAVDEQAPARFSALAVEHVRGVKMLAEQIV